MFKLYLVLLILLVLRIGLHFAHPVVGREELGTIPGFALRVRESFQESYQRVLPNREADLLSGVVLGSIGLDRNFKSRLAEVGLTHIVAASGMNITLFSGFVLWGLGLLRLGKWAKALLSVVFVLFYSTVTGFEPPIVRAALMAGLVILASVFGRQGNGLTALLIAGYIMLWVSPKLIGSASFLLSFFAMASQVFLGSFLSLVPIQKGLWPEFFWAIWSLFWQSFLAIVFTFPIVLWFFAKFSLVSLVSNTLVLWTIEPLMILGGLIGLFGSFSPETARLIALPASPLLAYFLWVVNALSGKDYFLLHLKLDNWTFPVGYYLVLGVFIYWWQGKSDKISSS